MLHALFYVTLFMGFVPPFFFRYKKYEYNREVRFMAPYVWLVAFASLYELVGSVILQINKDVWFRTYTLLDFIGVFYFFHRLIDARYRSVMYGFAIIFGLTFIGLLFYWNIIPNMLTDSYLTTIETVFIYTVTFLWFKDMFSNLELTSLWYSPAFYFVSAMILYYSGTFFLFAMSSSIKEVGLRFFTYWSLNVFFSLILRILLIIAIWKGRQNLIRYSG